MKPTPWAPGTRGAAHGRHRNAVVQAGDVIETVDGTPAGAIGVAALRERFRREHQVIHLGLRRGEACITVTLRTRRMI